jgi:hypothetical protein
VIPIDLFYLLVGLIAGFGLGAMLVGLRIELGRWPSLRGPP